MLTSLREPAARIVSEYKYIRRSRLMHPVTQRNMSLEQYVREYLPAQQLDNLMVRQLAGVTREGTMYPQRTLASISSSPEMMLAAARHHLDQCVFFSLSERFNDSLALLRWTFDLAWTKTISSSHVAPEYRFDDEELAHEIRIMNALDVRLYDYATTVFEQRIAVMLERRRQSPSSQQQHST